MNFYCLEASEIIQRRIRCRSTLPPPSPLPSRSTFPRHPKQAGSALFVFFFFIFYFLFYIYRERPLLLSLTQRYLPPRNTFFFIKKRARTVSCQCCWLRYSKLFLLFLIFELYWQWIYRGWIRFSCLIFDCCLYCAFHIWYSICGGHSYIGTYTVIFEPFW